MSALYPAVFETYEEKREHLTRWAKTYYVDEFGLQPCRMLEAGCAEGFWADVFASLGFDAHGFDIEEEYIEAGREKYPRVDLRVADAAGDLPYDLESFPLVFVRGMSCFYAYRLTNMRLILINLLRYVAPDGLLLIGAYSDGSGEKKPGAYDGSAWHHPHSDFVAAAQLVGTVAHSSSKGNYCQVGIRP